MTIKKRNRVLAIDDEPSMIEWLKILLEHEGYEVRTAMIGTRGEEIFKTWKPDVVVTDMLLPDADGLELLRKFKQIHADTEVIVVTGHGSVVKAVEAMKAGAHSFVEKPIEPDTLLIFQSGSGAAITLRTQANCDAIAPGHTVSLAFPKQALHYFDAATGQRVE